MREASVEQIERAHNMFGSSADIVDRRRTIYCAAMEFAGRHDIDDLDVDSPLVRAHLGQVLGGGVSLDDRKLQSVDVLSTADDLIDISGCKLSVASTDIAAESLAGAIERVASEISHRGGATLEPVVLTRKSSGFKQATTVVRAGLKLAFGLLPEIVRDLLPHVVLLAVLDGGTAGKLGSASVREYPGLLILPNPESALEVAEAFVHEASHQLFFDLAMTNSIFRDDHHHATRFSPPWAPAISPSWPYEQAVAAFHTYTCLMALAARVRSQLHGSLPDFSLLPVAAQRAEYLAGWLLGHQDGLGPAGCRFVEMLAPGGAESPPSEVHSSVSHELLDDIQESGGPHVVKACGPWTLVIAGDRQSPGLYWLPTSMTGPLHAINGPADV